MRLTQQITELSLMIGLLLLALALLSGSGGVFLQNKNQSTCYLLYTIGIFLLVTGLGCCYVGYKGSEEYVIT